MSNFVTIDGYFVSGATFPRPETPTVITVTDTTTGENLSARVESDGKLVCRPGVVVRVCSSYKVAIKARA